MTAGAVSRTFPIPGVADQAIGLKNIEEAVAIRDRMTDNFAKASNLPAGAERDRLLTTVVVGGGFAGIEVFGELRSFASALVGQYSQLTIDDTHFHLIEAMGRIMPEVSLKTSHWVIKNLDQRGATVHLDTQLASAVDGKVELSTGETFESDLIIWTAGVMANPVLRNTDLPVEERGRLRVQADLRVIDDNGVVDDAWGAGDACAVPDLVEGQGVGGFTVPNAQHAVRQGKLMAKNVVAVLRGESPREYVHRNQGAVAGIGLVRGRLPARRHRDQGPHRLVHAPRLPRSRDADVGAQGPRLRQLHHQLPDPARPGRHPGPRHPARRVRGVRRRARRASARLRMPPFVRRFRRGAGLLARAASRAVVDRGGRDRRSSPPRDDCLARPDPSPAWSRGSFRCALVIAAVFVVISAPRVALRQVRRRTRMAWSSWRGGNPPWSRTSPPTSAGLGHLRRGQRPLGGGVDRRARHGGLERRTRLARAAARAVGAHRLASSRPRLESGRAGVAVDVKPFPTPLVVSVGYSAFGVMAAFGRAGSPRSSSCEPRPACGADVERRHMPSARSGSRYGARIPSE